MGKNSRKNRILKNRIAAPISTNEKSQTTMTIAIGSPANPSMQLGRRLVSKGQNTNREESNPNATNLTGLPKTHLEHSERGDLMGRPLSKPFETMAERWAIEKRAKIKRPAESTIYELQRKFVRIGAYFSDLK